LHNSHTSLTERELRRIHRPGGWGQLQAENSHTHFSLERIPGQRLLRNGRVAVMSQAFPGQEISD